MSTRVTSTKSDLPLDERGVSLFGLHLTFTAVTAEQPPRWLEIFEATGCDVDVRNDRKAFTAAALPNDLRTDPRYLWIDAHIHPDTPGESHWRLQYQRRPSGEPPEHIVKSSHSVGGYPEVLGRLAKKWHGIVITDTQVSASYSLSTEGWEIADLLVDAIHIEDGIDEFTLAPLVSTWAVPASLRPLTSISVARIPEEESISLTATVASIDLAVDAELIPRTSERIWSISSRLLRRKHDT